MKEIENNTNGKTLHAYEVEELMLLKFPLYPKQSIVNTIPIKITKAFFSETEQQF